MRQTTRALDQEWQAHYAHTDRGRRALTRWSWSEPTLRGLSDLEAVLDARRDASRGGEILAALARLAPTDGDAARTLLQAMLPGLVRMGLHRFGDDPGAIEEIMALAWERICSYPAQRQGSVAVNVLVDVRKRYLADRHMGSREVSTAVLEDSRVAPSAEDAALSGLAIGELVRSARGAVTDEALGLILRTRVDDVPLRQVANEDGADHQRLQCLRWRAERRLRAEMLAVG